MQHRDYVKAAKELNEKAETTIKVVAVKGDVLQKSIQDTVAGLTDFDFSSLSPETLDVFDNLKCEMTEPEVKPKLEIVKTTKERTKWQQGPAMIAAAADLIDFLAFPKESLAKFEGLSMTGMEKELQKMADQINKPYEENGINVQPEDKPADFKADTLIVFEENDITVNWNEESKGVKIINEKTGKDVTKEFPETVKEAKKIKEEKKKPAKKEKKVIKLEFHEYANLFPDMSDDEFDEIVKDMNENGFRSDRPIILFGGKIADGKNRYKAANIVGIDAEYTNFDGTKEELFKHVIALNLKRRHLTPAQRASLAVELLPGFEKEAKEQQKAGGKGKKTDKPIRATEKAAKATGSTKEAVSAAKKVKAKAPEKFDDMKKGKTTIAKAKRETEEKTAIDKFNDTEKILKAKLKMTTKAIHDLVDAAEVAEQDIEYQGELDIIENAILTILG